MGSLPILKIVLFVLAFAFASMLLGFAKAGLQQRKANKQQRAEQKEQEEKIEQEKREKEKEKEKAKKKAKKNVEPKRPKRLVDSTVKAEPSESEPEPDGDQQ